MPVSFVENRGQWDPSVEFAARTGDVQAFLSRDAITLRTAHRDAAGDPIGFTVRLTFEEASRAVELSGGRRLPGAHSFFVGNDSSRWTCHVSGYATVDYRGLYEGVDLRVRETSGSLEYDVVLAEAADLDRVVIRCDGIAGLGLESDGSLRIDTTHGPILQRPPTTWYELPNGERRYTTCAFRIIDRSRFGFVVPENDGAGRLVVDPVLEWSTFVGGASVDAVMSMRMSPFGEIILAGLTDSPDFPLAVGESAGDYDWFVAALDADGSTLRWSTVIGGSKADGAYDLAIDDAGRITAVGITSSADFPRTDGAFQTTYGADCDGAVVCLGPDGDVLEYSTYVGGTGCDWVSRIAVSPSGEAHLFGHTESEDLPVTDDAYDRTYGGVGDLFAARLNATGTEAIYATYLGGIRTECYPYTPGTLNIVTGPVGQDIAVARDGDVILGGLTSGADFPTDPDAYDPTHNGGDDGFVARLSGDGSELDYVTFLGGSEWDLVTTVIVDDAGRATVVGLTGSSDFPTTPGAYRHMVPNGSYYFVSQLDEGGSVLEYSALIGGAEWVTDAVMDEAGNVFVVGSGRERFPTTRDAYDRSFNGVSDVVLFELAPHGRGHNDLVYSTFLGGPGYDWGTGIARDAVTGALFIGGSCQAGFPSTGKATDASFNGVFDGFVCRFDRRAMDAGNRPAPNDAPPVRLGAVFPNPTTGHLRYTLDVARSTSVRVKVFDVSGRHVTTLVHETLDAGLHELSADGLGRALTPGTYFLDVQAGGERWTQEFVLLR